MNTVIMREYLGSRRKCWKSDGSSQGNQTEGQSWDTVSSLLIHSLQMPLLEAIANDSQRKTLRQVNIFIHSSDFSSTVLYVIFDLFRLMDSFSKSLRSPTP